MLEAKALLARASSFVARYPANAALVNEVAFKKKESSGKNTALRPVLAISTAGLGSAEKDSLLRDYRAVVTGELISFYLWEKSTHLLVQHNGRFFDFGFWVIPIFKWEIKTRFYRFRERAIRVPNSRRLEPVVALRPVEKENLSVYLKNLAEGYRKVLGRYYDPGCQISNGRLDDNRADPGHNCTSWITTAPLSEKGECLIELLGSHRGHEIGTNPGWWAHWLLYSASADRVPLVIYWSPDPLPEILASQVKSGETIRWDFNRI